MTPFAVTDSASAAERETPSSMEEAVTTGFLPDDPHYRLTGEFKAPSDTRQPETGKPEERETSAAPGDKGDDKTAAASEAAETQTEEERPTTGKTAKSSESRWAKITRENRELREKLARSESAQSARETETSRDTTQASQPAADGKPGNRPEPKIDDVDPKTGKAKYQTWEDFQRDQRAWDREEAVRQFQETSAKTAEQQQRERQQREIAETLNKRFDTSRAKHADFDEVALNKDLVIPAGSATDAFLLDSEHAGEVAYYLGQHPEILDGFYGNFDLKSGRYLNKISPQQQFRKLLAIEADVSGSAEKSSSSVRPITRAPRPANQVNGTGTVAKDAVEQAVEDGDSETYMKAQNARELARLTKRK